MGIMKGGVKRQLVESSIDVFFILINTEVLQFGKSNSDRNIKIIIIVKGGMKRQLEELCHILKYVDPVFYSYLDAKVKLKLS